MIEKQDGLRRLYIYVYIYTYIYMYIYIYVKKKLYHNKIILTTMMTVLVTIIESNHSTIFGSS